MIQNYSKVVFHSSDVMKQLYADVSPPAIIMAFWLALTLVTIDPSDLDPSDL